MYIKLLRFYDHIRRCERLDPGKLQKINFERIKKLAIYAYENVDYYRELYDQNHFDPHGLSAIDDLALLPVVEKNHFRGTPAEKRTSRVFKDRKIEELTTSGSTGQPLIFYTDRYEMSQQTLKWVYVLRKYGYRPTDNLVQLYRPLASANRNFIQNLGLFRRKIISIFDSMDNIIDEFENTEIDVLSGLKSSLLIFGEELHRRNIEIRPKFLATTGEVLTANDRKLLSKYYDARTVNIYASAETGNIAFDCPECDYMHIHSDSIFINTHRSREGVYITSLENHVTPIINYNLGDRIVHLDDFECGCGSKLPLIQNVIGREDDIVISSSGRKFNTQYLWAKLKFMEDYIDQYKIVQREDRSITLKLKLNTTLGSEELTGIINTIRKNYSEVIGPDGLVIEFVDSIPVEKSGKIRVVENEYLKHIDG